MKDARKEINEFVSKIQKFTWDLVDDAQYMNSKRYVLSLSEEETYVIEKALEELAKKPNSILNDDAEELLKQFKDL